MKALAFVMLLAAVMAAIFFSPPSNALSYQPYQQTDCCCNRTHNFFFGRKSPYDRLLFVNQTYAPPSPRKTSLLLSLPPRPVYPSPIFTYIEVLDSFSDGLGGCARIINGGVGYKYVTLNITSSPYHAISSTIRAYGHY